MVAAHSAPMTDLQRKITFERLPHGRHGLPRDVVVRSQRERMLRAMADAVAERGYAATSVADVLKRAGVSRRTFYEQFANKRDCFLAAYDEAVSLVMARVRTAYAGPGAWEARLAAGFTAFLEYLATEPSFARMCVVEVLAAGQDALERRDRALADFAKLIAQSHRDAPETDTVPLVYFEVMVGGIYHVVHGRIVRGDVDALSELLPDLLYCAMAPVTTV